MDEVRLEIAKGAISLIVTLIGLGAGWVIGARLTYQWNLRQKRRESDLATAQDLQTLYGEFFAVWKLWNTAQRRAGLDGSERLRLKLLRRACDAEGLVERVFVNLAVERHLSARDRETLGRFRQGYQRLRHAIQDDRPLGWTSSEHPEYLAFKRLAVEVASIVYAEGAGGRAPSGSEAFAALREITANRHEESWAAGGPA
jgi:hypothetical protein